MVVTMVSIVFHPRKRFVVSWDKTPEKHRGEKLLTKFPMKGPSKFGSWWVQGNPLHQYSDPSKQLRGFRLTWYSDRSHESGSKRLQTRNQAMHRWILLQKTIGFWMFHHLGLMSLYFLGGFHYFQATWFHQLVPWFSQLRMHWLPLKVDFRLESMKSP